MEKTREQKIAELLKWNRENFTKFEDKARSEVRAKETSVFRINFTESKHVVRFNDMKSLLGFLIDMMSFDEYSVCVTMEALEKGEQIEFERQAQKIIIEEVK